MTSYRNSHRYPPSDAQIAQPIRERWAARRATSPISVGVEEHQHLRKATPTNVPLRRTLEWLKSLPPDVQPFAVVRRYARVANLIAATWEDSKAFHAYMESLLTDKRGNRKGFPPDVLAELLALQRHYDARGHDIPSGTAGRRG
jgi:hypothetical protein